jgi:hypothetical protein
VTAGCLAVVFLGVSVSLAAAQEPRWEVEGYGGLVAVRTASEGRQTLPPAGAPLVTSNPLFPSREVASWFFGDGAALLNAVNEEFGGQSRVAALDPLFAGATGGRTGAGGVRLRRSMSATASLEFAVDFLGNTPVSPVDVPTVVEAARQSFGDTFTELLRSGPFTSVVVDTTADVSGSSQREIAVTAAYAADLGTLGPVTPYLTFGGGIVTGLGAPPSAQLSGHYRFSVLGQVPVDESDRVTIAFDRPLTFTAVVGGGLRRDLSERWGLRVDVRAFIGPDPTRVRLTAEPSMQRGSPAGFVESFTNPSIQFSNDASLGRRSTLSAAALDGVTVFDGGMQTRTVISFGISRRF